VHGFAELSLAGGGLGLLAERCHFRLLLRRQRAGVAHGGVADQGAENHFGVLGIEVKDGGEEENGAAHTASLAVFEEGLDGFGDAVFDVFGVGGGEAVFAHILGAFVAAFAEDS